MVKRKSAEELQKLTKPQLQEYAASRGLAVTFSQYSKKADIVRWLVQVESRMDVLEALEEEAGL